MQENFSPQESLQLIQSMIRKARADLSENRFYFLLWGWVTFAAIITQFLLKVVIRYEYHYAIWLVTIPTAIATMIYIFRSAKKDKVITYAGESMSHLWTGLGISFFVLTFIITNSNGGWAYAWPLYILFYGLGTFVSGRLLQFTPLIVGGIFNWVLALASIYVHFDYQLLIGAAAILTSYIIPGHLLGTTKSNHGR